MRRGDLVIVSAQGDYGKPRPAVVIQNDRVGASIGSITVCFLTTDLTQSRILRVDVEPNAENGLRESSQVQVEKIMTFPREKVRGPIGHLGPTEMRSLDRGLLIFLDLVPTVELARPQSEPDADAGK